MSTKTIHEIQQYYDELIKQKIEGFINTNERVERAWETLTEGWVSRPQSILEVGCGIGDISWRMSEYWNDSIVKGIDISPKSVQVANKLFSSVNVSFVEGILDENTFKGLSFDLIVLMDVYEHIARSDRNTLHAAFKNLLSENGMLFLSFPTPRHLAWLRDNKPNEIQPIDENISIETIVQLSQDIGKEILLYKEVSVWRRGDYAHAILGKREWVPDNDSLKKRNIQVGLKQAIKNKIKQKITFAVDEKQNRKDLVKTRLGI